jgi:hypothetical protein
MYSSIWFLNHVRGVYHDDINDLVRYLFRYKCLDLTRYLPMMLPSSVFTLGYLVCLHVAMKLSLQSLLS